MTSTRRRAVDLPLLRRSRRRGLVEVPGRADVLAACSVLLRYPDASFDAARPDLTSAIAGLPPSAPAEHLRAAWRELAGMTPDELRAHYVETFDLRRRSSLFLTYYLHGDTRQRGMALLSLKQRYRASGFVPDDDELPDYVPMVLEFAARAGTGVGESALRSYRGGLELIRTALSERGSPYHHVLDALSALLGPVPSTVRDEVGRLALAGPPSDDAGLEIAVPPSGDGWTGTPGEPFGPPEHTCSPKGR